MQLHITNGLDIMTLLFDSILFFIFYFFMLVCSFYKIYNMEPCQVLFASRAS